MPMQPKRGRQYSVAILIAKILLSNAGASTVALRSSNSSMTHLQ